MIKESFCDLLKVERDKISGSNIIDIISSLEKEYPNVPKDTIRNNILLYYFISLVKDKIPFIVKGGFITQYYLKDNNRPTRDFDIITNLDSDELHKRLEEIIDNYQGNLSFKIKEYEYYPKSSSYYYDTINIRIDVLNNNEQYHKLLIDAIISPIFDVVDSIYYKMPLFFSDTSFKGVRIEYVMAEKIIAITNELKRPYKHLVDVYSLSKLDLDLDILKKYLDIILSYDNEARQLFGIDTKKYEYYIKDDKKFSGFYALPSLQAGYNISFDSMKEEVNNWLKENL